jgi:T5orf172 domain
MDGSGRLYVYTLPHYLAVPASPDGRTWLKVGWTSGSPEERIVAQSSSTGTPEPPVLLRVWWCSQDARAAERAVHRLLLVFGHGRKAVRGAGREWFLTSLDVLDVVGSVLGLRVEFALTVE